jgi:2'-hydroxyisoflavone reductase
MSSSRRKFLKHTALASSGFVIGGSGMSNFESTTRTLATSGTSARGGHPLRILILGGTSFIGPHLIQFALGRGHEISIFNRGQTVPTVHADLLEHVERLVGDRADNLNALRGRQWDVVIDNSGRQVEWTKKSAELLSENVGLYVYTSSTGVYYPYLNPPIPESRSLVLEVPGGIAEEEGEEYGYGVMKAQSELAARRAFGDDRTLVVRPTYIIGPGDRGNRFQHWPVRLEMGGEVMIPGNSDDPVQWIDVRDLAEFTIRMAEKESAGTYNVVGPASGMGMHACVHGIHAATSSSVEWVSIPDYDFLLKHGISYIVPWIMPSGNNIGSARVSAASAVDQGLTFRPLATTTAEILEWWHSNAITDERRLSLTSGTQSLFQREPEIIKAWRSR